MSGIADRLKSRRTRWIKPTDGAIEFMVVRPRALELARWSQDGNAAIALRSIQDWRGVSVSDFMEDGDATPQPFDESLRDEWLPDRPDLLVAAWAQVQELIGEHVAEREADEKN